jgi:cyanophycin synthetase
MRIDNIRTLSGPNVYSHKPVLVMTLYLDELADKESFEVPGFIGRLIDLLPGLHEHHCSKGRPGGFVERLREGTYFGHIVEHVALELTTPAGIPVNHGKTREADEPGCYHVAVEYSAEHGMRYLLSAAVELVEALVKGEPFPLDERIQEARRIVARTELGPSTRAIVDAAARRGMPWMRFGDGSLVQLGYGKNRKLIHAAVTDRTSAIAVDIATDKQLTKRLLSQVSIPVPAGMVCRSEDEAVAALEQLDPPVVVKPLDSSQGRGVSLNLRSAEEVAAAFRIASNVSRAVLVEEQLTGRDYRVLVVNNSMVAASHRLAAHVVGDGKHSIAELVEIANSDPLRGEGHEKPLTRIKLDSIASAMLARRGLTVEHVPAQGEKLFLCDSHNLSTGGTARDVTDTVHPEVARLCERAARVIGFDLCGIDLILEDISKPLSEQRGGILEINASPGLRMHHYPSEGTPRDVGGAIVEMLYPQDSTARIPVISITGTNGKTTVTRMIGRLLAEAGNVVGMTTTDGIYVAGELIVEGDTTGPQSARTVLCDSSVEVAVLETARGGITRRGLGYDWSDISVMTNIQADHIGQDGIRSIDDLVYIKSLVAERVKEGGTLVLNADDERLARLMETPRVSRIKKNVIYFSLRENHLLLKRHRASGGTAYFVKGGWIVEAIGEREYRIIEAAAIPVTMLGAAEFNIANVMAAFAACRAYGLSRAQVASAIMGFHSEGHNPGRVNLYRVAGGYVMLDYGHNPEALKAVCRMASLWSVRRVTGVIGVPGDRADSIIEQAGRVAARGFQRLIIKEDEDLRGRASGEVASLLCNAVKDEAPDRECIVIHSEAAALGRALEEITEGEIVIMFYDKLAPLLEVLKQFDAVPVSTIEQQPAQVSLASV